MKWILAVLALYLVAMAALYVLQGRLLFASWASLPPDFKTLPGRELLEEAAAGSVRYWLAPPQGDKPVIVFFHGNAAHALNGMFRAEYLGRLGYGVVLAEYRGYGGNTGTPDEQAVYADSELILRNVMARWPGRGIILYGESLGTGVAVEMAMRVQASAVVLEAPYTSIVDVARGRYPIFPVGLLVRNRFESLGKIARIDAPLLVLHGDKDNIVPFWMGQALVERAEAPKKFIAVKGAGHNNLHQFGILNEIAAFIAAQPVRPAVWRAGTDGVGAPD